jgi:hypothetical protein
MNKLFIGLLVIAVAGGAFFLLKKKKDKAVVTINKEWIIGKWKTESYQPAIDSVQPKFQYDFQKDGIAYRSVSDTVKADTISYAWKDAAQLVIKGNVADSAGTVFTVSKLTQDSLQVQGSDSVLILLTKVK